MLLIKNFKINLKQTIIMKSSNPLLIILSVLLPIVGYILFFAQKNENPIAANHYLWSAVGGSVIGILLSFV